MDKKAFPRLDVIIPAFNEEESIGYVLRNLESLSLRGVELGKVVVVDNASTDRTAERASEYGALVVREPELGYGSACLRGMKEVRDSDIVLFLDADGSDEVSAIQLLLEPLLSLNGDFVVGSRVLGATDPGALLPHQRFGNMLAAFLLRKLYNQDISDLGPCRAIRTNSLFALDMQDRDYGWTVEMQIKAFRNGLRYAEVPVPYHLRYAGSSKVAGSIRASFLAGKKILSLVLKEYWFLFLEKLSMKKKVVRG